MTMQFSAIARQAAADGSVSAQEILALRREGWADGQVTPTEAEAIFAVNDILAERGSEWCAFFVEAIGEYVINGWKPRGYVSEEQADWLISRIAADGRVEEAAELELLLRVLEKAQNAPDRLKAFALEQIERAVTIGAGFTGENGAPPRRGVSAADCRMLRRAIFAAGGDRPAAVSREEAEMLFRIKDAALGAANAPDWKQLFAQGVGNYLMGYAALSAQLTRERAAELEAFMADGTSRVGRFIGRMATSAPNAFGAVFGRRDERPSRAEDVADARRVSAEESAWLDAQIHANGEVDEYDRALLAFIAEETGA